MIPNILKLYFILLFKFISINSSYVLIDMMFKKIVIKNPTCFNRNDKFNKYRGAIINFDNIEKNLYNINNNKLLSENITNSFLYFSDKEKLKNYINYIPDSTLLFTSFSINYNEIKRTICYIQLDNWSKYHYIFISERKLTYLTLPLIFCFCYISSFPISIYDGYNESLREFSSYRKVYFYKVAKYVVLLSLGIAISSVTIYYFLFSYILYSIYKSYLLMNLILLLEGFSIIHFNNSEKYFKKYVLIIFCFDFLISVFSEYIVYFLPFLDNFFLFHFKSLIEHSTLLVLIFVFFHKKYIPIYKQYSLEKRLGTILARGYRIKKVIYQKIMIFSIVYCLAFIILPFIEFLVIKIDSCVEAFYVNYFISICMELAFNIALAIIFYPQDLTLYYFLPTIFDYNTFKFEVKIKHKFEDQLKISNLTRSLLKDEYKEKEYPILLIPPFCSTSKVFSNLNVGLIK